MDNTLLKLCKKLAEEEKAKKKKKALLLPKEKRLSYYSGWHKGDKPVNKDQIEENIEST